jgi:group I intron endonuclease
MHENRTNGKRYIGITSQKPERRWKNGRAYQNNGHFTAAVDKYGWDMFRHDILYSGLSKEEAERLEVELIAKYQTQDPTKGYNLREGGSAASCSEETRARMSEAARSRGVSPAAREAIRKFWTGNKHSPASIEKMRAAQKGRTFSDETRARMSEAARKKQVLCLETGAVYPSLLAAQMQTGIDRSVISRCCEKKPHCNTAGGYHWQYVDTNTARKEERV